MPDFDAAKSYRQMARSQSRGLVAGLVAVTTGLGLFWYAQQKYEEKKKACPDAAAVPTWEYRIQGQEPQTHLHTPQHGTRRTSDPIEPVGSRDQPDTKNAQRDKVKEAALAKVEGKAKDGEPDAKCQPTIGQKVSG